MEAFSWEDLPLEVVTPLFSRRVKHGEKTTMSQLIMKKGALVARHHHVNEQLTTIVSGSMLFRFDDREVVVGPGQLLLIPPDVPHSAEALEDAVGVDIFSPVREDWLRGDDSYLRGK